ncbi:solute carrier family 2, facilitated glucose transporter member 8-like [Galleria mellonella]|uniref:Solute carrier family 2, facilitated glucose transporter member 8-like n=1 Tax=Galleria mellonella TaxID=7137 RepID=A0ABM3MA24_GALME|nr:solute carrier family 2, facilitated glucose transporter member 8-like [Galleria mellonella]
MAVEYQAAASLIVSLSNFYMGYSIAWPSYALPVLESNTTGPVHIGRALTRHEGNLLGSMNMASALIAVLIGGYISEAIGRKRSEILSALCYVTAEALIVTASSPAQLLVSRLIMGLGAGLHMVVVYVFINEFCEPSIIGNMSSLTIFAYTIGEVTSYLCGWMLSYEVINYVILIYSVVLVILLCFLKESPVYLIRKMKDKVMLFFYFYYWVKWKLRGKGSMGFLKFYRNRTTEDVIEEFAYMKRNREIHNNSTQDLSIPEKKSQSRETNVFRILRTSKAARTALITITAHILLTIFMGTIPVQVYAGEFFTKAAPNLSSNLCSIILGLVMCAGSAVASVITDLVDRRILMGTSCAICTICLFLLGTLLQLSWAPDWVVAAIILVYCSVNQVGAANIPFVQIAESFVPEMKSFASTIAMTALCIGNFSVLTLFRPVAEVLGLSGTFFVIGIVGAITTVTSYLIMKETRRVSFEHVHDMYEQGFLHRGNKPTI